MPLSASHIKFAIDQIGHFKPEDLENYFSGVSYPDSRYTSGIERTMTHSEDFWPESFWRDDDFKKGWASHNISDRAYTSGIRKIFSSWGSFFDEDVKIENAAVKIVGDLVLLKSLGVVEALNSVTKLHNPNGEDTEKMEKHLLAMKDCYKNGLKTEISDYVNIMHSSFGPEIGKKVIAKAKAFAADKNLANSIGDFFKEGIKEEVEKIFKKV